MRRPYLLLLLSLLSFSQACFAMIAPQECWNLRIHGHRTEAHACFTRLTQAPDAYTRAEGFWGLEQWDQANEQFRSATAPPTASPLYKVRWGLLLHERFNDSEAVDLFREALTNDPNNARAYLGLATVSANGFDGHAMDYAAHAATLDPKLAEAHELIANLALENDDRERAASEADTALALDPEALDAIATHAALEVIADRPPDTWLAKLSAINPSYGEAYSSVAHHLELHYRFADAATYFRKAIVIAPELWSAHSALGIELMRLGNTTEPLHELELSYDHGYRNAATVNSLRLLDTFKDFTTTQTTTPSGTRTILKLHRSEADLLTPYLEAEIARITAAYQAKYGISLPGPVQVELYPNHEDFAVRTMGMPGLGALGVTFDRVVAMDSPSARKPGDFNWGATLWHEMSHVYVLTATHDRVPRWFTEGLAVHEEGMRSAEWRNRATPEVLAAIRDNALLPVEQLDRGFVHPEYPAQVIVSYFQTGSLCDFIAAKWNEKKLLDLVHAFADRMPTSQAIQRSLDLTPEELDRQYATWLRTQYGEQAFHLEAWQQGLKELVREAQALQLKDVLANAPNIIAMYPEYTGDANAYELLAQAQEAGGNVRAAASTLLEYMHEGGQSPDVLKHLAALQQADGNTAEAASTLERILYIYPVKDAELHQHLGELLVANKQFDDAIREFNATLTLYPLDKAGAEFHLAEAYLATGQRDKAQESVVLALETAPDYRPAQKLLLQLQKDQPTATKQ